MVSGAGLNSGLRFQSNRENKPQENSNKIMAASVATGSTVGLVGGVGISYLYAKRKVLEPSQDLFYNSIISLKKGLIDESKIRSLTEEENIIAANFLVDLKNQLYQS